MAEKIVSPGVFTNEIDQSFIPAALGEIGAAIVGPTVKGTCIRTNRCKFIWRICSNIW